MYDSISIQEPSTSGKVILNTSVGDIEIELWATETPKTCRNFIQLCLENYYDNTIFHRLIPNFMIQGGDPSGTGEGGQSVYGKLFEDEFNSKLNFSHRGIVAMANNNQKNTNGSQFFITFDSCSWLNKKHTIFGKVVGNTLYNFLKMEHLDTDENDKPLNPPKIISVQGQYIQFKVIINPFNDIIMKETNLLLKEEQIIEQQPKQNKDKTKQVKQQKRNMLSFITQEEDEPNIRQIKIKSSHDILQDKYLLKESAISQEEITKQLEEKQEENNKYKKFQQQIKQVINVKPQKIEQLQNQKRKEKQNNNLEITTNSNKEDSSTESDEYLNEEQQNLREQKKKEYENLRIQLLKFKGDHLGTQNPELIEQEKQQKKLLSNVEQRKLKYLTNKKIKQHESLVLQKLNEFRNKINTSDNEENWLQNKLKFSIVDSARAFNIQEQKNKAEKNINLLDQDFLNQPKYGNQSQLEKKEIDIDKLLKATENNIQNQQFLQN